MFWLRKKENIFNYIVLSVVLILLASGCVDSPVVNVNLRVGFLTSAMYHHRESIKMTYCNETKKRVSNSELKKNPHLATVGTAKHTRICQQPTNENNW